MKTTYWTLLVLSAVMYALPFFYTSYLWWLIFFFSVPLLYVASIHPVSFQQGFVWTLITFLLHTGGAIPVLVDLSCSQWLVGLALGLGILFYQALCAGALFWLTHKILLIFNIQSKVIRLLLYTAALALLIFWIDRYSLLIFDVLEGYCLMHPLIPLAQYVSLLCLLPIIGKQWTTILLLLFAASFTSMLLFKNRWAILVFIFTTCPWIISGITGFLQKKTEQPLWLPSIIAVQHMTLDKASHPQGMVQSIKRYFFTLIKQHPEVKVILLPESAFNSSALSTASDLLALWGKKFLGKSIHIIFGAFRNDGNNYYNTAHWIHNGILQGFFDKRHAMLLSERLSSLLRHSFLQSIYFNKEREITISTTSRPKINIKRIGDCVPYICSELFFNEYPDDTYSKGTVIALVNDSIFLSSSYSLYINDLLLLLARFKAVMWQRKIIYISYLHAVFIDKIGYLHNLMCQ